MKTYAAVITGIAVLLFSCRPGGEEAAVLTAARPYRLNEPAHFVKMGVPGDNPLTEAGVALGRRLFFDPILSIDSTVSCATCHRPEAAFTDGRAVSTGVAGRQGRRSAPSLLNVGYYHTGLFWDGRAPSLEAQAVHPVQDSLEMAGDWPETERRLQGHEWYPAMFRAAFGIKEKSAIDQELVVKALAQFQRTLISGDARFDRVMRGEAKFTPAEERGRLIFFDASPAVPAAECSHCHNDPLFTNLEYFNNGVDPWQGAADSGRIAVTGRPADRQRFRAPTLRNIAVTAPYMHDGRFETLEAVLAHYNSGGHSAPNLNPNVRPLSLSEQDQRDLIAFLHTLTDSTALNNPDYRAPPAGWPSMQKNN